MAIEDSQLLYQFIFYNKLLWILFQLISAVEGNLVVDVANNYINKNLLLKIISFIIYELEYIEKSKLKIISAISGLVMINQGVGSKEFEKLVLLKLI